VLAALALFFFSLFLPWTSLPFVIEGIGKPYVNGWSEQAYLSVLPFAALFLNVLPGRKPLNLNMMVLTIMLAFAMLLVDNMEHRAVWLTPLLVDSGMPIPHAIYGSVLDEGFWFALASMVALSVFGLVWTLHKSPEVFVARQVAPGTAGQAL
jgi:hypothetical protein